MRSKSSGSSNGFTLVEVLIGASLALMVMVAVLSSYVMLGRNFTRSLGVSSANQPTLESQSRRTLAYFTEDVRMASGISNTPSNSALILTLPISSGTTTVAYTYDNLAHTLTRTPASGTTQILQSNLLSLYIRYYDSSGNPYDNGISPFTTVTNYLSGIKQLSITFTTQAGSNANGTQTPIFETDSARLVIRNKALLQ